MKNIYYNSNDEQSGRVWFKNVKLIGELDTGTSVYIEDYVYTYIKQYSRSVLSKEIAGVLIGEHKSEAEQIIVNGFIPINSELLGGVDKWINKQSLAAIKEDLNSCFPENTIVGWMHTQPGYGLMVTTKEAAVHKKYFKNNEVLMLVDPISREESVYIYEENKLVSKAGFCIFYEKNKQMQEFMIDNPIVKKEKQKHTDELVTSFREMGSIRKEEALRRKKIKKGAAIVGLVIFLGSFYLAGIYTSESAYVPEDLGLGELEILIKEPEEDEGASSYKVHFVEIGDSLLNISYKYFENPEMAEEIAEINNITNQDSIYIGQEIKIPIIPE